MAFLAAKTFHLGDGHSFNADFSERVPNFLKFEGFDDGND
jgi:hypothetical protein